jgi:hypothetical protein
MTGGPIFLNNTYSGSELPVNPKNPIIKFFEKNKNFMEHYYSQWYQEPIAVMVSTAVSILRLDWLGSS